MGMCLFLSLAQAEDQSKPCERELTPHFSALPLMQSHLWELRAQNLQDEYQKLKRTLENQLLLTKINTAPAIPLNRHFLHRATDLSYLLYRNKPFSSSALAAYEFNEQLGGPLRIPVTVWRSPGALQIWYDYLPKNEEHSLEMKAQAIQEDADLFLFSFLISNINMDPKQMRVDQKLGNVYFGFDDAFYLRMIHFKQAHGFNDLAATLTQKAKDAKFNWKKTLNDLDDRRLVDSLALWLGQAQAKALQGRICVLRTILNGGDYTTCHPANLP